MVDLLLSDPPYGIGHDCDYTKVSGGNFGTQQRNKHKDIEGDKEPFDPKFLLSLGKTVILWGVNNYPDKIFPGTFLFWDKTNDTGKTLFSDGEMGWMNRGHGCYRFHWKWDGLNRAHERGEHYHPTQKPVALMRWCMEKADTPSAKCETILDPFMGSGTTLRAAKDLSRKAIGIEIEERYCEIAARRVSQESMAL